MKIYVVCYDNEFDLEGKHIMIYGSTTKELNEKLADLYNQYKEVRVLCFESK